MRNQKAKNEIKNLNSKGICLCLKLAIDTIFSFLNLPNKYIGKIKKWMDFLNERLESRK